MSFGGELQLSLHEIGLLLSVMLCYSLFTWITSTTLRDKYYYLQLKDEQDEALKT